MTHYSDNANSVRVDFFKPTGKWYTTEAVTWIDDDYADVDIHTAFNRALNNLLWNPSGQGNRLRYSGMIAVCLEPYHEHAHPLSVRLPDEGPLPLGLARRRGAFTEVVAEETTNPRSHIGFDFKKRAELKGSIEEAIVACFSVAKYAGDLQYGCAVLESLRQRLGLTPEEAHDLERRYMERNR